VLDITVLAPECSSITEVAAIKAELMTAMDKAGPKSSIILDITKTKRTDSSLAQLIFAFKIEAAAKGFNASIRSNDEGHAMRTMLYCDSYEESKRDARPASLKAMEASRER